MALTSEDLFKFASSLGAAQTHGLVAAPGHAVVPDALKAMAASSQPVYGGNAPPLPPAVTAAQPAPVAAPAVDPASVEPYPGLHPDLHNMLVDSFMRQRDQAAAQSRDAGAMLGPGGAIDQVSMDALDKTRRASETTRAAEEARAAGEAELAGREAEQHAADASSDEARMKLREKTVREYQTKADTLAEQAQNAEVRDFWADKSTGSRIMGILAQTLAGAANGLAGNPGAPSALDRIIDRDLEVQQKNMQNKRLAADHALNALGQVYNGFKDQDASIAAYRQAAAQWYTAKSKQMAAQFQGQTASARDDMVQAKGQQDFADSRAKLAAHAEELADRQHAEANRGLSELARDQAGLDEVQAAHQGDLVEVPGVNMAIRRALAGPAWQKQSQAFGDVFGQYDATEKLLKKPGFSFTDKAQVDAANSLIEGANRQLLGTGANLSKEEAVALHNLSVSYLKSKGANALSDLSLPDAVAYIHAMRRAVATTYRGRVRTLAKGADVARDPGFESAHDALQEDAAQ